jgi:hypothetical protein
MSEKEPWLDEPDLDYFRIKDMLCVAIRHPWGHWCGYVGVGSKHPLYGVKCSELEEAGEEIRAHGDINWSAPLTEFTGWYFGFDCGRAFDYEPYKIRWFRQMGMPESMIREHEALFPHEGGGPFPLRYRDLNYVRANCAAIAAQIIDIAEDEEALNRLAQLLAKTARPTS